MPCTVPEAGMSLFPGPMTAGLIRHTRTCPMQLTYHPLRSPLPYLLPSALLSRFLRPLPRLPRPFPTSSRLIRSLDLALRKVLSIPLSLRQRFSCVYTSPIRSIAGLLPATATGDTYHYSLHLCISPRLSTRVPHLARVSPQATGLA